MKPRPISEAPMDGTVILTDSGCARYNSRWEGPGTPEPCGSWVSCYPDGCVYSCVEEGEYTCGPKLWIPLPEWMQ